jgi:hypothetical protein
VHGSDRWTIIEALEGLAATVETARRMAGNRRVVVSPLTLACLNDSGGEIAEARDARQPSLFGAAWTVGALAATWAGGADVVTTSFGTVAPPDLYAGLRHQSELKGSASKSRVHPAYHPVADAGEWREGELVEREISRPNAIAALGIRRGDALNLLVANLAEEDQGLEIKGFSATKVAMRRLGMGEIMFACSDPGKYRSEVWEASDSWRDAMSLTLGPYEVVRVDARIA